MSPQQRTGKSCAHHHRNRSGIEEWLYRVRHSRRAKRKLINSIIILLVVLAAFIIGFFYFGPSFSSPDGG
jgi:hypothetical protein